jgi:hypothetical protein
VALGGVLASGVGTAGESIAAAAAPVVGPAGAPLAAPGPAGAPLAPAGPAGAPLPTAGPTGAPLPTAGPAGTPLTPPAEGPAGSPLAAGKAAPKASKFASKFFASKAAVIGTTVAVVAVGTVAVVLATRDDSPKPALGAVTTVSQAPGTTVDGSSPATTADPSPAASTLPGASAPATTAVGAGSFDLTPAIGKWRQTCQPYLAGDGGSGQTDEVTSPGPDLVDFVMRGYDYTTADCGDAGTNSITVTFHLKVVGVKDIAGTQVFKTTQQADPECVADIQEACGLALAAGASSQGFNGFGIDSAGLLRLPTNGGAVDAEGFPTEFMAPMPGAGKL